MAKRNKSKTLRPADGPHGGPVLASSEVASSSATRLVGDLRIAAAVLVLLGATFLTYRESFSGRLFFDDRSAIEGNPNVHALVNPTTRWKWATWKRAASSDHETPLSGRPVASLSFALNHWWAATIHPSQISSFNGILPAQVPFFHYVNLALHMLVALVLYALVRRTMTAPNLGDTYRSTAGVWAFFIALVWAVHPLNSETVVYVTQRTEQLVSLFLLLTLYCSARAFDAATPARRTAWYVAAVVACLLGMGSKENMIAAPLLVAAYDRAFNYASWREAYLARRKFYSALAATWLVLAVIIGSDPRGKSVGFHDARLPWYEYLITQCWCLWRYFWLTLLPLGSKLCVDYGRRPVLEFHHTAPGALLVFTLLGTTVWGWLRKPWLGFLGTCFFLILAPTSSFYPIITEVGAERRMYLPSAAVLVGVFAAISGFVAANRAKQTSAAALAHFDQRIRIGLVAALLPVLWLGYTSHRRTLVYQDDLTLYGHIVDVFPDNDRGCNNFGTVCLDRQMLPQAAGLFNRAVNIDPEYIDALTNRSNVFLGNRIPGKLDLSIADATAALNWQPAAFSALNNRATAYIDAQQFDRAEADFERLIKTHPYAVEARVNQAVLFFDMGEHDPKYLDKALASIDEAIRLRPHSYSAHNTRGSILDKLKRHDEAIAAFDKSLDSIRLEAGHLPPESEVARSWQATAAALPLITASNRTVDPRLREMMLIFPHRGTMALIFSNRAAALQRAAKVRNTARLRNHALNDLSRAIFLNESEPRYYAARGDVYLDVARYGEALHDFDTALNLNPDLPEALRGRIQANAKVGNYAAAKQDAVQLRKLGVRLDAAMTALVDDVLTKAGTP